MKLDFNEGQKLIRCYWGAKSFYAKPEYSYADGLCERINIHTITKIGFNKILNEKGFDETKKVVNYLIENIERWDGDIDTQDAKNKIKYANKHIYYFGKDNMILLFSIIDKRKDFTQSLKIFENNPLIELKEEPLEECLTVLCKEWNHVDILIRWGDGGSYVHYLRIDITKLVSEYIYFLLENNKCVADIAHMITIKMFWDIVDLLYSKPHKRYDMCMTLFQLGLASCNNKTRFLFVSKYLSNCAEKYGSFGWIIGYVYIVWCRILVLYGIVHKIFYEKLNKKN